MIRSNPALRTFSPNHRQWVSAVRVQQGTDLLRYRDCSLGDKRVSRNSTQWQGVRRAASAITNSRATIS